MVVSGLYSKTLNKTNKHKDKAQPSHEERDHLCPQHLSPFHNNLFVCTFALLDMGNQGRSQTSFIIQYLQCPTLTLAIEI